MAFREADRGMLDAPKTAVTGTPAREEDWTLDGVGNWDRFDVAKNGATVLNQTRTHNRANEIAGFAEPPSSPSGPIRSGPHAAT